MDDIIFTFQALGFLFTLPYTIPFFYVYNGYYYNQKLNEDIKLSNKTVKLVEFFTKTSDSSCELNFDSKNLNDEDVKKLARAYNEFNNHTGIFFSGFYVKVSLRNNNLKEIPLDFKYCYNLDLANNQIASTEALNEKYHNYDFINLTNNPVTL